MAAILEQEYKVYLAHLKEFISTHRNQFVLIKGEKVVSFFERYEDALQAGLQRFGNVPFFVKEVQMKEEVHFFHQEWMSA